MRGSDYVLGYVMAVLPIALIQNVVFFAAALLLGLEFTAGIILAVTLSLPISLLFVGLGILLGSCVSEKAAPGVASIAVQLVAFTGGMYFDGEMMGGFFAALCRYLPFSGAVDILKGAMNLSADGLFASALTVSVYTAAILVIATVVFTRNMRSGK